MGEALFRVFPTGSYNTEVDKCSPSEIFPGAVLVESLYHTERKDDGKDRQAFFMNRLVPI